SETLTAGEKADDRYGPISWCVLRRARNLGHAPREPRLPQRASAAGPYGAGDPGQALGQSQSLATPLDPLVQRQRTRDETRDGQHRHANPWRRRSRVAYSGEELARPQRVEAPRLSTRAAHARGPTPSRRTSEAPLAPPEAGQGEADSLSARPRSHGGMPGRSPLLGVQLRTIHRGGASTRPQRLAS